MVGRGITRDTQPPPILEIFFPVHRAGNQLIDADGSVTDPFTRDCYKRVSCGQELAADNLIAMLEAMKMENPVTAHKTGTVTGLSAQQGDPAPQDTTLCELKD
ncbi:acetyl-CoA carboxylase biotin carboxyl carrier protein subunit [Saccharopolyspora sp. NPDC000995]